ALEPLGGVAAELEAAVARGALREGVDGRGALVAVVVGARAARRLEPALEEALIGEVADEAAAAPGRLVAPRVVALALSGRVPARGLLPLVEERQAEARP